MTISRMLLTLLLCITNVVGISQQPPGTGNFIDDGKPIVYPWDKTLKTAFPIYNNDPKSEWVWLFSGADDSEFFINTKDLNVKNNEITAWVRCYYFKDDSVSIGQWSTKMREKQTAVTNIYLYRMKTGENWSSAYVNAKKAWAPIIPESTADGLYKYLESIRSLNRMSSPVKTGKVQK